jgi:N6-L-threonylcarbamoyladenine synthase
MISSDNLNFSFSGLKTAVLYLVKKNEKLLRDKNFVAATCHEFQQAVIDVLISKTLSAAKKYNPQTVMLAGGVSANKELREQLGIALKTARPATDYRLPAAGYSIDNAAMIAAAGCWRYSLAKDKKKIKDNWKSLDTRADLEMK